MAREDETHHLVGEVSGRIEHEWAATINHGDAVRAAEGGCGGADAALPVTPMHPDVLDTELGTLPDGALGFVRRGGNDDGLDPAGDALQVVITAGALDLVRIGVDGEHLVPA